MYTSTRKICIFPDIFLLQNGATWDKMQSTGFNFFYLIVPARDMNMKQTCFHHCLFTA